MMGTILLSGMLLAAAAATEAPEAKSDLAQSLEVKNERLVVLETELEYVRGAKGNVRIYVVRVVNETRSTQADGIRIRVSRTGCDLDGYVDAKDLPEVIKALKWLKRPPALSVFSEGDKYIEFDDRLELSTSFSQSAAPYYVAVGGCEAGLSSRQATELRRTLSLARDFLGVTQGATPAAIPAGAK